MMGKLGYLVLAGACAATIALAGCAGNTAASSSAAETESSSTEATQMVGGWRYMALDEVHLDSAAQKIFDTAAADADAKDYTPVAVLATQVVAGTNYAFLCEGGDDAWHIVAVYNNLQNEASILSDKVIDPSAVKSDELTRDGGDEALVGAWEVVMPEAPAVLPEDAWISFDDAYAAYEGHDKIDLIPVAALGSQVVSGTNYRILCAGQTSADEPASLYLVDVYASATGDPEFTDVRYFDLLSYIEN